MEETITYYSVMNYIIIENNIAAMVISIFVNLSIINFFNYFIPLRIKKIIMHLCKYHSLSISLYN